MKTGIAANKLPSARKSQQVPVISVTAHSSNS